MILNVLACDTIFSILLVVGILVFFIIPFFILIFCLFPTKKSNEKDQHEHYRPVINGNTEQTAKKHTDSKMNCHEFTNNVNSELPYTILEKQEETENTVGKVVSELKNLEHIETQDNTDRVLNGQTESLLQNDSANVSVNINTTTSKTKSKRQEKIEKIVRNMERDILCLIQNEQARRVVENFFKQRENKFIDISIYTLPVKKTKESFDDIPIIHSINDIKNLKIEIDSINDEKRQNESVEGKNCVDNIENVLFAKQAIYDCLKDGIIQIEEDDDEFFNIKNDCKGNRYKIYSLYCGLWANGIINNIDELSFFVFLYAIQEQQNATYLDTLLKKYDINYDELKEILKKAQKNNIDFSCDIKGNTFIDLIQDVLQKNGNSEVRDILILCMKYMLSFLNYELCNETASDVIKLYNDVLKQKRIVNELMESDMRRINSVIANIDNMTGIEFEKFITDLFKKMGYDAHMTKASGDQGIDIIARRADEVIGIQAKCYSGVVGNHAIMEAVAGMRYYKCDYCMVVTNSTFTKSAKELAIANGVELWDRKKLIDNVNEVYEKNEIQIKR
mgnify:CR=1 FL=1